MSRAFHLTRGALVALVIVASAAKGQDAADDVKQWLDRMNTATEELNYRGTFVYISNGNADKLQIAHRYVDGKVRERISATSDNAREILRTGDHVLTVMPEERRVMVEELQSASIPRTDLVNFSYELASVYDVETFPKDEIAGRATQYVGIRPRDGYRYGYRLWLDRETGLPLKSQVTDEEDDVVEQILFTDIEIVDVIPEAEVVPAIGVDGFDWVRRIDESVSAPPTGEFWGATRLPDGFRLTSSRQSMLAGSTYPVQHLVYTDGLATVSVYIAHPKSSYGADIPEGFSHWGSTNIYTLRIDGRLATAWGEVPARTVERIATSLDAR